MVNGSVNSNDNTDQVNCYNFNMLSSTPKQLVSLISIVKNDVLGTVPKFCHTEKIPTLNGQNDLADKALNHFVKQLNNQNIGQNKDLVKTGTNPGSRVEDLIFQTLQITILKKIWTLSSEEKKYDLLLSDECSPLGLNRFPIKAKEIITDSNKSSKTDQVKQNNLFYKTKKVCQTESFNDLAPFISKDILAESLYLLKKILPNNFPIVQKEMCNMLSKTDEYFLKNDQYENYIINNHSVTSINEFSKWMENIYSEFNKTIMDQQVENNLLENQNELYGLLYENENDGGNEDNENMDPNNQKLHTAGITNPLLTDTIVKTFQEGINNKKELFPKTTDEIKNLTAYTGSGYENLNTCLRKENCSDEQQKKINSIISVLNKIRLNKIANGNSNDFRFTFRGTREIPEVIYKAISSPSAKDVELDKGFLSTSADLNVAKNFSYTGTANSALDKGLIFIIKSKNCVGISKMSGLSREDEFLCPPGLKFNVKQKEGNRKVYILEEK